MCAARSRARSKPAAPVAATTAPGDTIFGFVHPNEVGFNWMMSWNANYMASEHSSLQFIAMKCGSDGLPNARNKVAQAFLDSGVEWLWWTDTDQGFKPDTLDRLHDAADAKDRPIVGALAFINREVEVDEMGGYRTIAGPAIYRWVERADGLKGFTPILDYQRNSLIQVHGIGSACILIHRSVFEAIAEKYGPHWYTRMTNPEAGDQLLGEDLSFCARAAVCGFPIYCHTGIPTNHLKPVWLSEEHYHHPELIEKG